MIDPIRLTIAILIALATIAFIVYDSRKKMREEREFKRMWDKYFQEKRDS